MKDSQMLLALMTAILYPHAVRWSENTSQSALNLAMERALEILEECAKVES